MQGIPASRAPTGAFAVSWGLFIRLRTAFYVGLANISNLVFYVG